MSHPDPTFDPENVRPSDWDAYESRIEDEGEQRAENEKADEDKRMEEHFTKEPDNFGGKHYL